MALTFLSGQVGPVARAQRRLRAWPEPWLIPGNEWGRGTGVFRGRADVGDARMQFLIASS